MTIFEILNNASLNNDKGCKTYGSISQSLNQQQRAENKKNSWNMNSAEEEIYNELQRSDRTRLVKFG